MTRDAWLRRIKAVAREFRAAAVAVSLLEAQLRADPSALNVHGLRKRDATNLRARLEATYLIRLFAEFETGLREAWRRGMRQTTHPPMRDLLDAVAARRNVGTDWLDRTHAVRRYRNALVHETDEGATPVAMDDATEWLCAFFSRLPSRL
jgi:hypothetical protein